jgi:hypothetical protein
MKSKDDPLLDFVHDLEVETARVAIWPDGEEGDQARKRQQEWTEMREREAAESEAEKAVLREDVRRARLAEIFSRKRWIRADTVLWVAFGTQDCFDKSVKRARLYGDPSLRDPSAENSLAEAVQDGRLAEYKHAEEVWYLREQVLVAFPEALGASAAKRRPMSDADFHNLLPHFLAELFAAGRFNKDDAWKKAQNHFHKSIDRNAFRALCSERGLKGTIGRPELRQNRSRRTSRN